MDLERPARAAARISALERRDPTLTELKLLDTYWSDHCRHTTFLTELDALEFFEIRVRKETYETYLNGCGANSA